MKTWAERITELEAAGWSLTGIGSSIGLSPQSLSDIKQGRSKEPRGMAAVKLHELWSSKIGDGVEAAHEPIAAAGQGA